MLTILKYEIRKTRNLKLILLGLTLILEGFFLFGVYTKNSDYLDSSIVLLVLLAIVGIVMIGIHSMVTLHHDMNTKQSYMLFMTPHSNFEILGAKAVECTLSVAITGVFFFLLGVLDLTVFVDGFQLQDLIDLGYELLELMDIHFAFGTQNLAAFFTFMAASWIETVMIAFFADILASSILKGKRFNGLLSFLLFVLISYVFSEVVDRLPDLETFFATALMQSGAMMVIAVIVFFSSAVLMEKKLSV